ncbi:MAG: DUF1840 domain-containing protein [Steroidobacteraceae bacterium]|nr:DUF1840 domain-containing protein [Steroidobacteraceae bacterium]
MKFSTRVGALTLHGEAAVTLLKAMGHSGTVPGAVLAADLPAALASLRSMLAEQARMPPPEPAATDEDEDREREPPVALRARAVPLIDMIETAIARDSDLMWERG